MCLIATDEIIHENQVNLRKQTATCHSGIFVGTDEFSVENGLMDVINVGNFFSVLWIFTCKIISELLELEEGKTQKTGVNWKIA